jgi:outer membrane protein
MDFSSRIIATAIAATLAAGSVQAEDQLQVGVIAQSQSAIYRGADRETDIYPWVRWESDRFEIDGDRASFALFRAADEGWRIGPALRLEFDGYESGDSDELAGMEERSDSVFVGANVEVELGWLDLEAFAGRDIGDGGGTIAEIELGLDAPIASRAFGFVAVGLRYGNATYAEHLYGVRTDEARPGRAAYAPGSTLAPFGEIGIAFELSPRWTIAASVEYLRFDDAIRDSPIVDADSRTEANLGFLYRFK